MTRAGRAAGVALTAATLAARLPFDLRPIYILDEAVFALGARAILDGGLVYRDVWDHRGPLLHYVYAGVFALFGVNAMVAVHVVTTLAVALETWWLYRLAATAVSPGVATWAAFLFAFFSTFGGTPADAFGANAEIWTNLFVLLGLRVLLAALRAPQAWRFAVVGLGLGLAGLTKQIAYVLWLLAALAIVLGPAWGLNERRPARAAVLGRLTLLTLGTLAPLAAVVGYYAARGALSDLARLFVDYNVHYLEAFYSSGGSASAGAVLERVATALVQTIRTPLSPRFTFALAVLGLVAVLAVLLGARRSLPGLTPVPPALGFFVAWLALTAVPTLVLGRAFRHYYLLLLPAVAVLAAWVLGQALQACRERPLPALVIGVLLAATLLAGVQRQINDTLALPTDGRDDPLFDVANAVAARTRPDDRIYFWGRPTELYVMANRRPASRIVFPTYLTGWTPGGVAAREPGYRDAIALWRDDLVRYRPRLIIDGHRGDPSVEPYPLTRFPDVWRLVETGYRPVQTIEPYVIYERVAP